MITQPRTLIVVATYNEIDNLPLLVDRLMAVAPAAEILVIDDNSPDGTGRWCEEHSTRLPTLRCLHRPGKLGLGTATISGLRFAVDQGFELVLTMDADFSHDPRFIPALIARLTGEPTIDVVVGSRYVAGGGISGWPWYRRIMSRLVNGFARLALQLPVADCSGAFRGYRTEMLSRVELSRVSAKGYGYLEELLWLLKTHGARFDEVPIQFADRTRGETKISWREAVETGWTILRLGFLPRRRG